MNIFTCILNGFLSQKYLIMKKLLFLFAILTALSSFKSNQIIINNDKCKFDKFASSSIYLHNNSTNRTIQTCVVNLSIPLGGISQITFNTNLGPGQSVYLSLGNITQNVNVVLNLSGPLTGCMQDWSTVPDFEEMGCQNFFYSNSPSLTFYLYSINHLYLFPTQIC